MPALVQLAEGTVFATDFRVVRPLSEGGMGAVYVVEQLSTGKQRALKVMHPNLVHDERQRQRFVQEAKIGARIESDHVVEVLGAGVDAATETPWLVMELLQGETLDQRLERTGTLTRAELAEVYKQLCHALAAAHEVGVVHRDLKPENIFLAVPRREGIPFVVKILDFGIAKLVAESGNTTQAIGSPLWMAPEQTNADAAIVPATDVWALGLLAFTCLTGHSYWRGAHAEAPNPMSLVMEVCFDPLQPATERANEFGVAHLLPPGFDAWFAQCVERDPGRRFSTAKPARAALERILLASDVVGTQPVSMPVASTAPLAAPVAPDLELPVPQSKKPKVEAEPAPAPAPKPPPPAPKPSASASGGYPKAPERIVIPPIKPAPSRVVREMAAVERPHSAPPPWGKIALGVAVVLGGLFAAQRLFWTRAATPAPSATATTAEPPKQTPSASASAAAPLEKCAAGMARILGGAADGKSVEPFCLDVHEVTVKAYAACVKSGKCTAAAASGNWTATSAEERTLRNQSCNAGRNDRLDHPINCVDWTQADAYCAAQGRRLPTEAELEWAIRSGAARFKYPWGFEVPDVQLCWSSFTARKSTCAVGSFPKGVNTFGVHDLAGNVREWTSTSLSGNRVHCGGDWTEKRADDLFRLGYCGQAPKTARSSFVGFRCAQ